MWPSGGGIKMKKLLIFFVVLSVILMSSCAPRETAETTERPVETPTASAIPADVEYSVKTDYSKLEKHEIKEQYERLSENYMPKLIPSDDYGTLLTYVGAYGYDEARDQTLYLYGLVTTGGMMVTDAVYRYIYTIYRVKDVDNPGGEFIYMLEKEKTREEEVSYLATPIDVCPHDGSWLIEGYYGVKTYKNYIVCLYEEYKGFDVFDWNGEMLYSSSNLEYGDMITWIDAKMTGMVIDLSDGTSVFYNVETKQSIPCPPGTHSLYFYDEGLAPLNMGDYYQYINEKLNVVIPEQYVQAGQFYFGRAVVQKERDGPFYVIGKSGKAFNTFSGVSNVYQLDGIYIVTLHNNEIIYYDRDFNILPDDIELLYTDGSYYRRTDEDTVELTRGGGKYVLNGVEEIYRVEKEYVIYITGGKKGLKTLDDKDIVLPLEGDTTFIFQTTADGEDLITVRNTQEGRGWDSGTFKLIDTSGNVLLSGMGSAYLMPEHGLIEVRSRKQFGFMTFPDQEWVFRVSLLDSYPD
jgi:hypothetical protein